MEVEKAKKKLCPFLLLSSRTKLVVENAESNDWGLCEADSCMMWRWNYTNAGRWDKTVGYCGLAGKPEKN